MEGLEDRRLLAGDGPIADVTDIEHPSRYTLFGPNLNSPESRLFHPKTDVQYTAGQNSSYQVKADIRLNESEDIDSGFINNIPADAQFIPLGFDDDEDDAIDIRGELLAIDTGAAAVSREDDGSILTANEISILPGIPVTIAATIGDQTVGFNDADFYELLEVQPGQLITASVTGALDSAVLIYDSAGNLLASNDDLSFSNFDSYVAYMALEADDYYVAVIGTTGIGFFEPSDPFDANTVGPGFVGPYELTVGVDATDADYYAFELEPGDIFGVNARGGVNHLSLLAPDGSLLVGSAQDLASLTHPLASPLPSGGVAALSWVVDTPGTYYLQALGTREGRYQLETRLFRPVLEQQPPGVHQILFLDFNGAAINTEIFGGFGIARLSPMSDFLLGWDLSRNQDALIDRIVKVVEENFISDMRNVSNNPNASIEIRNSRDHADPFGQPNVSRVIVGGTIPELGIGTIGIAQSVDVGNFETEETAVVLLDLLSDVEANPNSLNQFPIAPRANKVDLVAAGVGNIVVHEAGHFFGTWHTNQFNDTDNIMDQGGNLAGIVGVGEDRVWGTQDDVDVDFAVDQFVMNENFFGMQNTLNAIAFGISAGSADLTTRATGVKWNDLNGNGLRDPGEPGISGVRVYVDVNGDDVFGIGEPVGITAPDGSYVIRRVPTGQFAVREVVQPGWERTFPVEGEYLTTFRTTREVTGLDFGNQRGEGANSGVDFSDAPASYGVATHNVVPGLTLGKLIDGDPGPIVNDGIDDDGVVLSELVVGRTATVSVTISTGDNPSALLQGWVDFDGNGRFDASEQIIRDAVVSVGENSFAFQVPSSAFAGDTFTRFRYGYERGIGPTGAALAGEVEDYGETIETTGGSTQGPDAVNDSRTVAQGSLGVVINVLANDQVAEGKTLFVASVGTPSAGGSAVRSADQRSIVYSPASGFVGNETFSYTASDGSLTDTAVVTVTVEPVIIEDNLVRFRLQPTDANGQPITQVAVGSDFQLRVFVEDLQDAPGGVFAAYLDIEYDAGLASVNGAIQYGDSYENGRSGNTSLPGLIDEAGAFDGFTELGGGEFLLVSLPMQAVTEGTLAFASNPADVSPNHDVLLFGGGDPIADEQIDYQTGTVTIVAGVASALFTNPSGAMDVNNDGQVSPIDALTVINELNANGPRALGLSAAPVAGVFVDVSGDNFISSIDALLVINYLNDVARRSAEGEPVLVRAEGENVVANVGLSMTAPSLATVARQAARNAAAEAHAWQLVADQIDGSDDDDMEGLLAIIADDIVRAS